MTRGSVYKAKERAKYIGLVFLIIPFFSWNIDKFIDMSGFIYWYQFIVFGIFGSILLYAKLLKLNWEKVNKRYMEIYVTKNLNYHRLCITSLINDDIKSADKILQIIRKNRIASELTSYLEGIIHSKNNNKETLLSLNKEFRQIKCTS